MNFEQLIETELANLNKKLSSKKNLYDIGVYEDVLGSKDAVVQEDYRGKRKGSYSVVGERTENDADDDEEDDDDDSEDDDDDDEDEKCNSSEVPGFPQNDTKRNLLDGDLQQLLKIGASTSGAENTTSVQVEEVLGLEDIPAYVDINLKRGTGVDESCRKLTSIDKLLQKSVIQPGFEKQHAIPYETSEKRLRLERKKQRERTKGAKWFNMPAPELTDEAKNDLMVLQMRAALDPKHFYKKNDLKVLPKYFQVGKVVDAPEDFYSSRIPKKQRKKTIVDELLADAEFKKYNKRRYLEIIAEKKRTHHKAHKHAQRLKRKGKKK